MQVTSQGEDKVVHGEAEVEVARRRQLSAVGVYRVHID